VITTTSIIATNVLSLASKGNQEKKGVKNFWFFFLDNNGQRMSKGSVSGDVPSNLEKTVALEKKSRKNVV
jgi:hypothetical protein